MRWRSWSPSSRRYCGHEDHRRCHGRRQRPAGDRQGRFAGAEAVRHGHRVHRRRGRHSGRRQGLRLHGAAGRRGHHPRLGDGGDVRRPGHRIPPEEGYRHGRGPDAAEKRRRRRHGIRRLHRRAAHRRDPHHQAHPRHPPGRHGAGDPHHHRQRRAHRLRRQRRVYAGVSGAVRLSGQFLRAAGAGRGQTPGGPAEHRHRGQQGHRPAEADAGPAAAGRGAGRPALYRQH